MAFSCKDASLPNRSERDVSNFLYFFLPHASEFLTKSLSDTPEEHLQNELWGWQCMSLLDT